MHADDLSGRSATLNRCLAAYQDWLVLTLGGQAAEGSGTDLLGALAEAQRAGYQDAASLMGELLTGHTGVVSLVFEHKMGILRTGASSALRSPETTTMLHRQLDALRSMHATCNGPRLSTRTPETTEGAQPKRPSLDGSPAGGASAH